MTRLTALALLSAVSISSYAAPNHGASANRIVEAGLPILFEPAPDQTAEPITMIGRLPGVNAGFGPGVVALQLQTKKPARVAISFPGALPTIPQGGELEKSYSNYLLGNDPSRWRTHVPNYGRVTYHGLYPGIDAVFYGHGQLLEHDFEVAPGADYRQVRMRLSENAKATMDKDGGLTIAIAGGQLRMHKPLIYQIAGETRQLRRGSFQVLPNGDIGFRVGSYNHSQPLVIDPVLSFSTYLSSQAGGGGFVAADNSGNSYLTGYTVLGFPVTPGAFPGCGTCTANEILTYVSKISVDGKSLIYSTLLGGNAYTQPFAIAVDANGNALVAGITQASDFPTKNGQPAGSAGTYNDFGFLVSLSADGSSLNYGTLLGGIPPSGQGAGTTVSALAVDSTSNAYIAGTTNSSLIPPTAGALNNGIPGLQNDEVFLSKFSPAGVLIYTATLGDPDPQNGGGGPTGASALAVDQSGDAFVAGEAGTLWPTTSGAYLRQVPGALPYATPFVMEVAPDGGSVVYSTYLDYAYQVSGIVAQPGGNVFVAGSGAGATYPTTPNAFQPSSGYPANSFLTELNATGTGLVYSTLLGDATYYLNALALDPNGDLWVAGQTQSGQFPLLTPLVSIFPGFNQFPQVSTLSQFDPTGTILKFSTFLGGTAASIATGVAIDGNHRAHVAAGAGFGLYTTPGAYLPQVPIPAQGYQTNLFPYVALVDTSVAAPAVCVAPTDGVMWGAVPVGMSVEQRLSVTNCGTLPLTLSGVSAPTGVFTVPPGENGCTQAIPVGRSCTLSVRYSPTGVETDNSLLTLVSNASVPQAFLPLYASGVVARLVAENAPQFDYTLVGQTSKPVQLVIQNQGGAPLIINLANSKISGDFSLQGLGGCSGSLASGQYCILPIYFTPTAAGSRTGTLQIASNDLVNPVVSVPLEGTGYVDSPVPQITNLITQMVPAGVAEPVFQVFGFGFLPTSVVELNGIPQQTTYADAGTLNVSLTASSIPANAYGEIAVTVVTPAPGGGQSAPYTLTEYQSVTLQSAFLIYEPVGKQMYASVPAVAAGNPNTVIPINPLTAAAGTPIAVGHDPGVMATSSDGAYLYVALNADHTVQRINLATLAVERTFALPIDPQFGNLQVTDMHVVPGSPTEIVVSLDSVIGELSEDGAALFNDAGLVNWLPGSNVDIDKFTFTNNPNTLYAVTAYTGAGLEELTLDPTGVQLSSAICCSATQTYYNGDSVVSDGTLLYMGSGQVWNPATNQLISTYSLPANSDPDTVLPDASSGKTYFLNRSGDYDYYPSASILAFDQKSLAQTASLSFAAYSTTAPGSGTQLVRWGSNGFGLRALESAGVSNAVLLFTSSIAASSNFNPTPVAGALSPASTPAGGADFTLTVTGSNFISGSTVEWNGSPRLTTVVSATQLTATVYASDIAMMGTAQVTVMSPGNGAGASAALPFSISAAIPPPPPPPPASPAVILSPASLSFAAQAVTTASAAQSVTLSNGGSADLTGVSISIGGANAASFAENNNCGPTVSAGKSCTINATFTPGSAGTFAATVNITDNAAGSPQSVALTGTGTAAVFVIAPQSGGGLTTTVTAGQPAIYNLSLAAATGYSGTVTLSCSGLPVNASCSFAPASLALAGGKTTNFTVTIATQAPQASLEHGFTAVGAGVLLLLPWMFRRRGGALVLLLLAAGMYGCGGGSSSPSSGATTQPGSTEPAMVAPGTYALQIIATDGTTAQKQPLTLVVTQ